MAQNDFNSESSSTSEQSATKHGATSKFSIVGWAASHKIESVLLLGLFGVMLYFFGLKGEWGVDRDLSTVEWMWVTCGDRRLDYLHGRLIPLLMVGLLIYRWPALKASEKGSEAWGLAVACFGIACYLLAERVLQARIAAGSIPVIAFGLIVYLWGKEVGRYLFFPCCLVFFAIPLPGLLQATSGLQIFSTKAAAVVGKFFQIDLVSKGSQIASVADKWQFEVNEGCSGMRSLVALTLTAAIYGHLTQDRLWKKVFLIAAALPLAIVANAMRVSTIVLIAEYVSSEFAGATYHNWSGFLFFLAVGLSGLLVLSKLINGRIGKGGQSKVRLRKVNRGQEV